MTFGYPVSLDLGGVAVLVVGAGPVAARKVAGLVAAGARVRVVASEVGGELNRASCDEVHERPYRPVDLDGVRLVVTATGHPDVDAGVAADARAAGIWVNAADQPADCDYILPAIARAGRVTIAVSTDGASPALARYLRDRCAEVLSPRVVDLAEELAAARREIRAAGGSTEDVDWGARIAAALEDGPAGSR